MIAAGGNTTILVISFPEEIMLHNATEAVSNGTYANET